MGMRYQSDSFKDYLLAWANNLRARWAKLSFGDQGQFFRREALGLMGGYPAQMLMEDVELSLRLKENGLVCYIPKGIIVSQRRWVEMGFWKNCKRIMTLCLAYLIQRRLGFGDTMRKSFYNRYYAES
jgi:GT2 family glycosyltransferase